MGTIQINLLYTLLTAMIVLCSGGLLGERVPFLKRFSIPAPVVGGVLIAVILAVADSLTGTRVSFDMSLKDPLLLMFFVTVGLSADIRMLMKGGPQMMKFLLVCSGLILLQDVVGILSALALDLHPAVGLLAGSITLAGGHGTGAAYALRFGETMGVRGAMEMAMACATAGLVLGGLLGGAVSESLIKRDHLSAIGDEGDSEDSAAEAPSPESSENISAKSFLYTLFVILACLGAGKYLASVVEKTGFILPDFLFCLLLGVILRNLLSLTKNVHINERTVDLLGNVSLSMFLVMALMSLNLKDLASVAGPLFIILAIQTVVMVIYVRQVTFAVMGRNYDAAVLAGGNVGFGMGTTAVALAVIKAVTDRSGPSRMAFLIIPIVGAFFMDITNAVVIQGFLALPFFKFG